MLVAPKEIPPPRTTAKGRRFSAAESVYLKEPRFSPPLPPVDFSCTYFFLPRIVRPTAHGREALRAFHGNFLTSLLLSLVPLIASTFAGSGFFLSGAGLTP